MHPTSRSSIALLLSLLAGAVSAADGDLDVTYDSDGVNSVSFGASDITLGGFLQADGKLVVVGGVRPVSGQEMGVVRFNTNGTLDSGFATAGKYSLDVTVGTTTDRATCVGQQSDGKLIVGGFTRIAGGNDDYVVIRLTTAGVLDTTFGTNGIITIDFNGGTDRANALRVLPDNRIVIAGYAFDGPLAADQDAAVAVLTANGALDTNFSGDGKSLLDVGNQVDEVQALAVQLDGKILTAGVYSSMGGPTTPIIARWTSSGALDTSFGGGDGYYAELLSTSIGDVIEAIEVQTDGKVVAAGRTSVGGEFKALIMRLTSAGALDSTFNSTGFNAFDLGSGSDSMDALELQADGKYALGGYWLNGTSGFIETVLARVGSAGALDATFASGGIRKISVAPANDQIVDIFLDSSQRLVAAVNGSTSSGQDDLYAARFLNTVTVSLPTLSINDVSVTEGNSGTTNATFTVSLSAPAGAGGVSFDIATANNTATGGSDYVTRSLTGQSIPAGSSTYAFTVQVNGDLLNEVNETFFVNVTNVTGATVGDGQGQGTINNDDALPTLAVNEISVNEGNSGSTNATFDVTLSAASGQTVTVDYATSNGTAAAGSDYTAASGTLTFTPGQTSRTFNVAILGDTTVEPNETFNVTLSGATNATIGDSSGVGTILNDDTQADLSITKANGTETSVPGTSTTYTITASNAGPGPVSAATVSDTFPASLTCTWTCVGAGGGTCAASGSGNISQIVNLPVGGSTTFTATCAINAAATGNLSNTATIASGVSDPTPGNNSATDTDSLLQSADLAITKTNGTTTSAPGGSTTYTIIASNAGPSSIAGAIVNDTLPAGLTCTWTCAGAGGGACTPSGSGNISDTVNLPIGGSTTFTASCSIGAGATGSLSNTATVLAAGTSDPSPSNNSAIDLDLLEPSANLGITKTNGVASSTPGGSTTYTITASNAGPSNVTGATVADTFPASLTCTWTCVGAGGGTCTASGSGNISDTVNLPSGGSTTYTATCAINAAATGTLSNTATVSSAVADPTPGNNSATDSDTLNPQADVAITKTDGATSVNAGGSTVYTITASNAGPSNVPSATVADTFPAFCVSPSWTCAGAGGGSCTASASGNLNQIVSLPVGGSVTFSATCPINSTATGTLSNTATAAVGAGITDPTPGNNSATDTSTIVAVPVLSINSVTLTEGDSGSSNLQFQVTRTTTATAFDVSYATANGTAIAGSDYTSTNGVLSFTAGGAATQTINVPITGETLVEASESFTLTLSNPTGTAQIGANGTGTGTITDNDSAVVNFAPASISQSEGTSPMAYTVTLSNPVQSGVTLTLNSTNGTAGAADYTPISGATLSFAANSNASQTVNVIINNDALDENDETYSLTLSGLAATGNVTLGTATANATILDDDAPPTMTLSSPSVVEGDISTLPMNFLVNLSAPSGLPVSFTFTTGTGTATPVSDYTPYASTSMTIAAGVTASTVQVAIVGDTLYEANETVVLNLTGITNATPGTLTATGTIIDDDQEPTTTTINSDLPDPSVVGQPYPVAVTVAGQSTSPTGTVNVSDGGASCTITLVPATAPTSTGSCNLTSTTAGAKTLTASYTASTMLYGNSSGTTTHQVNAAATTISVSGPARSRINQPTAFSFALAVTAPGAGTPSGTVTLSSGASSCTATLPATSCNLAFTALGNRTVSASYAGDGNYAGSSSNGAGNTQTLVYAQSDIAINKTDAISIYQPGELLVYTVTVRNLGPDAAAQIRVRDDIPAGLQNTVWSCDASGGAVCPVPGGAGSLDATIPTLPVGGLLNFTFYGNAGEGQEVLNTALIELPADTTIEDPASGNNTSSDLNKNEYIFRYGYEDAQINAANGSFRVPGGALRSLLGEVAVVIYRLDDARGEALRIYARQFDGRMQYALALRNAQGQLRLGAWQNLDGEPQLNWTAASEVGGWVLSGASLR